MDTDEVREMVTQTMRELFGADALDVSRETLSLYVTRWDEAEQVVRSRVDTTSWSSYRDEMSKYERKARRRRANGAPETGEHFPARSLRRQSGR